MKTYNELTQEIKNEGFEFDSASICYCKTKSGKVIYYATLSKKGLTSDFVIDFGSGFRRLKNHLEPNGEGFSHNTEECVYRNANKRKYYSGGVSL